MTRYHSTKQHLYDELPSLALPLPLALRGNPLPISDRLSRSSEESDLTAAPTVDRGGTNARDGIVNAVPNIRLLKVDKGVYGCER
jgi:hypothetical protein